MVSCTEVLYSHPMSLFSVQDLDLLRPLGEWTHGRKPSDYKSRRRQCSYFRAYSYRFIKSNLIRTNLCHLRNPFTFHRIRFRLMKVPCRSSVPVWRSLHDKVLELAFYSLRNDRSGASPVDYKCVKCKCDVKISLFLLTSSFL